MASGNDSGIQPSLIDEYRTRLIADVVTGKVDVREAAAGLPEVDPLAAEDDPDDGSSREAESEGTGWRHGVEEGGSLADVSRMQSVLKTLPKS